MLNDLDFKKLLRDIVYCYVISLVYICICLNIIYVYYIFYLICEIFKINVKIELYSIVFCFYCLSQQYYVYVMYILSMQR